MSRRLLIPLIGLIVIVVIAIISGPVKITANDIYKALLHGLQGKPLSDVEFVIWSIRLPRILTAIVVGIALSVAGATYQGMFKNPLVSPDILGVSVGAGLGAALAIFFSFSIFGIQLLSFLGGIITVALVYFISICVKRLDPILALVLTGIAVASILGSFIALIKLLADPYTQLTTLTFWMLGSLSMATISDLIIAGPLIILSIIPLYLLRWRMNLLSLDDEEAEALGVNIHHLRIIFILSATLMTSAAVSIAGIVGWIGLVVPHIARLWIGPDFRKLLPCTLIFGAGLLLLTDTISRTAFPIEIPLGILTAFIGAPFFIGLLVKGGRA